MFKSILNQRSSTHARLILYGLLIHYLLMFKTRKYLRSAVVSMDASPQCWGQEEEPTVKEEQLQLLRSLIGLKMSLKFFDP